jgi:hypothetical protein
LAASPPAWHLLRSPLFCIAAAPTLWRLAWARQPLPPRRSQQAGRCSEPGSALAVLPQSCWLAIISTRLALGPATVAPMAVYRQRKGQPRQAAAQAGGSGCCRHFEACPRPLLLLLLPLHLRV